MIWGGLHGLALAALRMRDELWPARAGRRPAPAWRTTLATAATFVFVCFCWIFFRAQGLSSALEVVRSFALLDATGTQSLGPRILVLLAALALLHGVAHAGWGKDWWRRVPTHAFYLGYGATVSLMLAFVPASTRPFIYFQF